MDPLLFAAELLEHEGAVVEPRGPGLDVLLPSELAGRLGWQEETHLVPRASEEGEAARCVGYGTTGLEQLLDLGKLRGSIVCFRLEIAPPAMRDLAADARRSLRFHAKGPIGFGSSIRSFASYLRLHYVYEAVSEESREGLCSFAVNESTLAALPADFIPAGDPSLILRPGGVEAGPGAQRVERVLQAAHREACRESLRHLAAFLASLDRRRARDRDRLHAYYESLAEEIHLRKGRGRPPGEARVEERMAALRAEFDRKIRDLDVRYAVRVRVRPAAIERITMPILQCACDLRWKRAERAVPVVWNPILHDIEPLACDGCGAAGKEMFVSEDLAIRCDDCREGG